jgi:drug/metabolite transporter (DMT)-like permease
MTNHSKNPSNFIIYTFMGLMVLTGACNTIFNKLLDNTESLTKKFDHFFFITYLMFIGETFCFLAFIIYKWKNQEDYEKAQQESNLPQINPFILAIPATCDFFGSTIMSFSLTMMAASVYQMTRGSIMIFTAVFSVIFLGTRIWRHQKFSLFIIFIGIGLVGLGTFTHQKTNSLSEETKTEVISLVMLVLAQLFSAAQFVIEEKIVKSYHVHPLQMVGWEGIWGTLLYTVLLGIFYQIECEPTNKLCYVNNEGIARLEDFVFAFAQIGHNPLLLLFTLGYVCSIATYNYLGISITKFVSSPARAVLDNGRTVIIWLFFLVVPGLPQNWREEFIPLQLFGFLLLVFGTFVYNEFIEIPLFGLNKETESNRKCNEDVMNEEEAAILIKETSNG